MNALMRIIRCQKGANAIEYALVASLIAIAAMAISDATSAYSIAFAPFWHWIIRINARMRHSWLTRSRA